MIDNISIKLKFRFQTYFNLAAIWREDEAHLGPADPGHLAALAARRPVHAGAHRGHPASDGRPPSQEVIYTY